MTKRAAIYCRISRDREGAGLGVDRQEQDCRELAAKHGLTIAAVHRDNDLSAYSGKPRKGYRTLLEQVRTGEVDTVIAWHTDRLHRRPVELEEYITACEQRGVPTLTVKAGPLDLATPSGRLVARQLGAVARYEVEHSIERIQRAKVQTAMAGGFMGGRRPYGFEPDGVTVRPHEAAIVKELTKKALAGASWRSLAADLNGRGELTTTGRQWSSAAMRDLLIRARNAGLVEHRGEVVGKASWPAIVDEGAWRALCAVVADPSRRTSATSARRWLGSGLYLCGVCDDGTTMRSWVRGGKMRTEAPGYVCRASGHLGRVAGPLDDFVTELVIARLSRADAIELLHANDEQAASDLYAEQLAIREQLDELATLYAQKAIDGRQMAKASGLLSAQLAAVDERIANLSRGSTLEGLVGVDDVRERWEALDLDRRSAVVSTLMTVTILPVPAHERGKRPAGWRPGDSYFRPETIRIKWVGQA